MKNLKTYKEFMNETEFVNEANYFNNIARDIARNFKKITSVDLKSMFDDYDQLDNTMLIKIWPKIREYLDNKYGTLQNSLQFEDILNDVLTDFYKKKY